MRKLGTPEAVEALALRLGASKHVGRFDAPDAPEAWALAYMLAELEYSFCRYVDELVPSLVREAQNDDELLDVLFDIGDEFRHIVGHLRDSRFYAPYVAPTE